MIKTITSKDNPRIKFATSLKENKYRKLSGQYLGETKKSMMMAKEMGLLLEVFTLEKLDLDDSIIQNIVTIDVLKKISSNVNPEVVFIAKMEDKIPDKLDRVIYLDDVQDPGNLGTIIRTALAFGYDAIYVSENTVSKYNEKVINSTKGAIYKIPVIVGKLDEFKNTHQIIVSALSDKSKNYKDIKLKDKFVLVLGNEAHGVKEETKSLADEMVIIPVNDIDSLNVAVAGGILMSEYCRGL